jgi:integrase
MRAIHRLTDKQVKNSKPGLRCDGGGLYLQTTQGTGELRRSWLFRFAVGGGKERMMGLGPFPAINLAAARQRAAEARSQRALGVDPLDTKASQRASQMVATAKSMTFDQCVTAYVASHRAGWTPHYANLWTRSIEQYASPVFGRLPVSAIDTGLVMRALEPIWTTLPVVAPLVRGRIEAVLDWATVRGYRTGENPTRWKGHLKHLLPAQSRIHTVEHFPSLPYAELPAFITELRGKPEVSARALEFLILTATRTSEVTGARWDEIQGDIWVIPAERMKGGREHRVPLSGPAMRIIERQRQIRENDFVFPGQKRHGLSRATMDNLLVRMDREITVHGFRSTFRDWAAETTPHPNHVVEMALAHKVGNAVEAAYRRGDLFEKRRALMNDWARYCESTPVEQGKVVPIRQVG